MAVRKGKITAKLLRKINALSKFCESSIEAIDLQAEDLATNDTVAVTWEVICK